MADFVMAKLAGGTPTWINVDQITSVVSYDGRTTTVSFGKEHSILIEGPPGVIVNGRTDTRRVV